MALPKMNGGRPAGLEMVSHLRLLLLVLFTPLLPFSLFLPSTLTVPSCTKTHTHTHTQMHAAAAGNDQASDGRATPGVDEM